MGTIPLILPAGTVPDDVVLSELRRLGFEQPERAISDLRDLGQLWSRAGLAGGNSDDLPPWWLALNRLLREVPLKDVVLETVAGFAANAAGLFDPFRMFAEIPRTLEVLARVACGSPWLTRIVLAEPDSFRCLLQSARVAELRSRESFVGEAREAVRAWAQREDRLQALHTIHRRELLRIGLSDAFGLFDLRFVTLQLSLLADAMVQVCLEEAVLAIGAEVPLPAIIALGKHGGEELNYSSDIDLIFVSSASDPGMQRLAQLTIDGLSQSTAAGFLYRVDLRLRPWGNAGPLVAAMDAGEQYLRQHAQPWEKQALLKARCVAGDQATGAEYLRRVQPLLFSQSPAEAQSSIRQMKEKIELRLRNRGRMDYEVKLGAGSIRDVEFIVQYLQLVHGRAEPRILRPNTLDALVRLAEFELMPSAWYQQLREGYVFLRAVEHSLQLVHNRQTHEIPADPLRQEELALRLDYPDAATLLQHYDEHRRAVRRIFEQCVIEGTDAGRVVASVRNTSPAGTPAAMDVGTTATDDEPGEEAVAAAQSSAARQVPQDVDAALAPFSSLSARQLAALLSAIDAVEPAAVERVEGTSPAGTCRLLIGVCGYAGWFSDLSGIIVLHGLDIRGGAVVSDAARVLADHPQAAGKALALLDVRPAAGGRRTLTAADTKRLAVRLKSDLSEAARHATGLLTQAVPEALVSRICRRTGAAGDSGTVSAALDIRVSGVPGVHGREVVVTGADAPGLLFQVTNSLRVSGFRIADALIVSEGDRISDRLTITELNGDPVSHPARVAELQTAVTLIRRFMRWLPTSSDPSRALMRFRSLLDQMLQDGDWPLQFDSLQRPDVLSVLARVLGVSPWFWDELLQLRHTELFPVLEAAAGDELHRSQDELVAELDVLLADCASTDAARRQLSTFRDGHLFRIALRNLLGQCRPFGRFSTELTELAELVVLRTVELAWRDLAAVHGRPESSAGTPCAWTIAAIGKFGGVEMGFASDIEMLLAFDQHGTTSGPETTSNAAFFDALVTQTAAGMATRADGIFHVDLRMRPWGQAGSAAVSVDDLEDYYRPGGSAWHYERQSLVKLRCVGGSGDLARRVHLIRDAAVYSGQPFDFAAMRAMRERQIRQLVRGGRTNAKLSDGALVDCEYAVQALQMTFGHLVPALRTVNTLEALDAAEVLGLVSPEDHRAVRETYVFLRDLIDGLRLERGLARDLSVPQPESEAGRRLVFRLQQIQSTTIGIEELDQRLQIIRQFSHDVQRHCRSLRAQGL